MEEEEDAFPILWEEEAEEEDLESSSFDFSLLSEFFLEEASSGVRSAEEVIDEAVGAVDEAVGAVGSLSRAADVDGSSVPPG